jgi:restriction system protein
MSLDPAPLNAASQARARPLTIADAVLQVMRQKGRPLSPAEAYGAILEAGLYVFHSDDPISIVRNQIRRRCVGLEFASAVSRKLFSATNDGRYTIADVAASAAGPSEGQDDFFTSLEQLSRRHEADLRERVAASLRQLPPTSFERFARRLLVAYGFLDVVVTRRSRDGGIDGHGRIAVGLTEINVAFQCKRYDRKPVGRVEIDTFRGAIAGLFEQGYVFTTSRFTSEAVQAQRRAGTVPLALFDCGKIVDIMLERGFGISFREYRLPELALDEVLEEG